MEEYLEIIDSIDKTIFGFIILLNIVLWKKKLNSCLISSLLIITIGFILPLWSSEREVNRNIAINGPAMDSFELFYTFFIFPIYWVVLTLQLIIIFIKPNPERARNYEDILDK